MSLSRKIAFLIVFMGFTLYFEHVLLRTTKALCKILLKKHRTFCINKMQDGT